MPVNNNRKEYIEIPINIEETPLQLFEKFTAPELHAEPLEIGLELLERIHSAVRSPNCSS